jgi:hypothetical protein
LRFKSFTESSEEHEVSEKINLRMLDPKPLAVQPHAASPEASFSAAAGEDVDLNAKFEQEEKRERAEENQLGGWIGGAIGAVVSALIIAFVAAAFHLWVKWLSIGIGFAVAFGVRRLGHGSSKQFGVIGATWSFIGCVVAYHLAWIFVLAHEQEMPVMEFVQSVDSWSNFIIDVLGPRDFAIYVAAMAAGYKFSYNNLSDQY